MPGTQLHQGIQISVSKRPVFVHEEDTEHTNAQIPVLQSPMCVSHHAPRCQLRVFVSSASCQETNWRLSENTNTLVHRLCLDPSCRNMTPLKMQNQPRESMKSPGICFFFFLTSLHAWLHMYIFQWSVFFYDFTCCSQKNIHSSGLWKSILLEIQGIGILFNSTSADKEKAQLGQLIAEKEHSKCVYLKDCCRKQNCHVTIEYNIIQF